MRLAVSFLVIVALAGCEDADAAERKRLRKQQAELDQLRTAMLPLLYQSQAELAAALNGRDPNNLTVAEQAELHHLGKKFEGAQYAINYIDAQLADVQYKLDALDDDD